MFPKTKPPSHLPDWLTTLLDEARDWCAGRAAWLRAPIWAYLVYAGIQHCRDSEYSSWFGGLTFGIHELGHVVMGWGGHFIEAAGGSFWQLAVPVIAIGMFYRQRDWYAISVGASWLAFSMWNLATYVGDARAEELPLLGLTDDPEHDWHYLLGATGLLEMDTTFAFILRAAAFLLWAGASGFGAWLLWQMFRRTETENMDRL